MQKVPLHLRNPLISERFNDEAESVRNESVVSVDEGQRSRVLWVVKVAVNRALA